MLLLMLILMLLLMLMPLRVFHDAADDDMPDASFFFFRYACR